MPWCVGVCHVKLDYASSVNTLSNLSFTTCLCLVCILHL